MLIAQSGTRTESSGYRGDGQLEIVNVSENGAPPVLRAAFTHAAMRRMNARTGYDSLTGVPEGDCAIGAI